MSAAASTPGAATSAVHWQQLMQRLALPESADLHAQLCAAYAEPQRHYHTLTHIDHCLALFAECRTAAVRPDEIELAIWFHDAVYKPVSQKNEARSADWAARFLDAAGAGCAVTGRVRQLILATVHAAPANEADEQLLVDVDLSILGADESDYADFEEAVREEYRWVPGPLYRRERRRILQSFLDRAPLYRTPVLRERFEARAHANLAAAIASLG